MTREEKMRREVSPGQAIEKDGFILWLAESGLVFRFYTDTDGIAEEVYWEEQALGTVSTWDLRHRCRRGYGDGVHYMIGVHQVPEEIDRLLEKEKEDE